MGVTRICINLIFSSDKFCLVIQKEKVSVTHLAGL